MDKAEIRAKAEEIKEAFEAAPSCAGEVIEAALTAAHDAGWDEGVKAAEITVGPSIHLGKEQVAKVREKIRRLRKDEVK